MSQQLTKGAWDLGAAFARRRKKSTLGEQMAAKFDEARANKAQSEADLNQLRLNERQTGPANFVGGQTGLSNPQVTALGDFWDNGSWGQKAMSGPPLAPTDPQYFDLSAAFQTPASPPMQAAQTPDMPEFNPTPVQEMAPPAWYTPAVADKANMARSLIGLNRMATGDTNAEELAKGLGALLSQAYQSAVAGGGPEAGNAKQALAAGQGKPTYNMTASGIGYEPFGGPDQKPNTTAFDKANQVKAKATVDAALARARVTGNKLPAEAALVEYYKSQGYDKQTAIKMAKGKKNTSVAELAAKAYADAYKNAAFINPDLPPEQVAEQAANQLVAYTSQFDSPTGDLGEAVNLGLQGGKQPGQSGEQGGGGGKDYSHLWRGAPAAGTPQNSPAPAQQQPTVIPEFDPLTGLKPPQQPGISPQEQANADSLGAAVQREVDRQKMARNFGMPQDVQPEAQGQNYQALAQAETNVRNAIKNSQLPSREDLDLAYKFALGKRDQQLIDLINRIRTQYAQYYGGQ